MLRSAALVCCEDTRRTGRLLQHAGVRAQRLAVANEHTEVARLGEVLDVLGSGGDVAVVTDAGTPGVSDPGERLVRAALDAGFEVTAVPGPAAVIMAVTISGLPTSRFVFEGLRHARPQRHVCRDRYRAAHVRDLRSTPSNPEDARRSPRHAATIARPRLPRAHRFRAGDARHAGEIAVGEPRRYARAAGRPRETIIVDDHRIHRARRFGWKPKKDAAAVSKGLGAPQDRLRTGGRARLSPYTLTAWANTLR